MFLNNNKKNFKKYFNIKHNKIFFEKNDMTFNIPFENFVEIIKENDRSSLPVGKTIYSYIFNVFLNMNPDKLTKIRQKCIDQGDIDIINPLDHYYKSSEIAISELSHFYTDLFVLKYPTISHFITYSLCDYFNNHIKKIELIESTESSLHFFSDMRKESIQYIFEDMNCFINDQEKIKNNNFIVCKTNESNYQTEKGYSENFNDFINWSNLIKYLQENKICITYEEYNLSCNAFVGDLLKREPSFSFELKKEYLNDVTSFLSYTKKHNSDGFPVFELILVNYSDIEINKKEIVESFNNYF